MEDFQKLNVELTYDSVIPRLTMDLKESKSTHQRIDFTYMFIDSLCTKISKWNQPRCLSITDTEKTGTCAQWNFVQS